MRTANQHPQPGCTLAADQQAREKPVIPRLSRLLLQSLALFLVLRPPDFIQPQFQFINFFGVLNEQVIPLSQIIPQVVEFTGLVVGLVIVGLVVPFRNVAHSTTAGVD
jgi:hypothetical protein